MWMLAPVPEDFQELIPLKLVLRSLPWVLGIDLLSSVLLSVELSLCLPFNYSPELVNVLFEEKKCMIGFHKGQIRSEIF